MSKNYKDINVYDAAIQRIKYLFSEFDNILVAFSGGKDSGICLNLCYEIAKKNHVIDKMAMFCMDYEADFEETDQYIERTFNQNFSGIKKFWLCLPVSAQCSFSKRNIR